MNEFPNPLFELGDYVLVYMEDPVFACYTGMRSRVRNRRWMNGKEAGEIGVAGWQYQLSAPLASMYALENLPSKLMWCPETMLRRAYEVGEPFEQMMEQLLAMKAGDP